VKRWPSADAHSSDDVSGTSALAAMYAATGNVENLERLGSDVQKTSPDSGAEMRNLASALKAQKGVSR